mgnify:CR=1 FL=1
MAHGDSTSNFPMEPSVPLPSESTIVIKTEADGTLIPGRPIRSDFKDLELPGYELLSELGTGGMGTVFLARQTTLDRYVAIKMIRNEFARIPTYSERLLSEAKTMAALNHPNVVGCHDIIETEDGLFLVMEYIPGRMTTRDLLVRYGPLPEQLVIQLMINVLSGLEYIHQKGFAHRDLKPDNLLVLREKQETPPNAEDIFKQPGTRVIICDFGIAQSGDIKTDSDMSSTIIGSPAYMAPEQMYMPEKVDFRTDIYALAGTAYYLLTGQPPFTMTERDPLMEHKRTHPIPDPRELAPDTSPKLSAIIARMGKPHPDDRYQSYQELIDDLQLLLMNDVWFTQTGKKENNRAFRNGIFLTLGIVILIATMILSVEVIEKSFFKPVEISLAQSIGFWEEAGLQAWQRMPPDMEESKVYLRGRQDPLPIVLKRPIFNESKVEFKVRFFGGTKLSFGLLDENNERLKITWTRDNPKTMDLMMSIDGRSSIFIGDLPYSPARIWKTFRLEADGKRFLILAEGKIIGVANFKSPPAKPQFFVFLEECRFAELKDVFLIEKFNKQEGSEPVAQEK